MTTVWVNFWDSLPDCCPPTPFNVSDIHLWLTIVAPKDPGYRDTL